jgi:hypothetical protein
VNRELIVSTLFQRLTAAPMVFAFAADLTTGSAELTNVSDASGLMVGMPINGDGVPEGATLATIEPTVTITLPVNADRTGQPLIQGFQTKSRRLARAIEEVDMPALYLLDVGETHPPRVPAARPGFVSLYLEAWVYSTAGEDPDVVQSTALNVMLDAIEAVLEPTGTQPGGGLRQPLGLYGVLSTSIDGEVEKDPGYDGRIAGAVVPIRIAVAQHSDTRPLT